MRSGPLHRLPPGLDLHAVSDFYDAGKHRRFLSGSAPFHADGAQRTGPGGFERRMVTEGRNIETVGPEDLEKGLVFIRLAGSAVDERDGVSGRLLILQQAQTVLWKPVRSLADQADFNQCVRIVNGAVRIRDDAVQPHILIHVVLPALVG